jgi:glycosyltransferase involved in cell wall biosynthesis
VGEAPGRAGEHLSPASPAGEPDLALVVPVYNEAENFPRFYRSIVDQVRTPWRLLVVYDREEDSTLPVARGISASDPRVELVLNAGRESWGRSRPGSPVRPPAGWW